MPKARWAGKVIAESDACVELEGNLYFPRGTVKQQYLVPSPTKTVCPWKGEASYYHVEVDGMRSADAAWYYGTPSEAAKQIKDHIAFWKGVRVDR